MKGIILAGGLSTRIRNDIPEQSKCLLKVNSMTLLEHNIARMVKMGVTDIFVVTGANGAEIKDSLAGNRFPADISFITQEMPLGVANAVDCAAEKICGDDFVMCLSDELLINEKPEEMYEFFISQGADCVCGVTKESIDTIRQNYSVRLNNTDEVAEFVEKPFVPFNNYKGTGFCMFRNSMLDHLKELRVNPITKQYELCDWLMSAVNAGKHIRIFHVADEEININTYENYMYAGKAFSE